MCWSDRVKHQWMAMLLFAPMVWLEAASIIRPILV